MFRNKLLITAIGVFLGTGFLLLANGVPILQSVHPSSLLAEAGILDWDYFNTEPASEPPAAETYPWQDDILDYSSELNLLDPRDLQIETQIPETHPWQDDIYIWDDSSNPYLTTPVLQPDELGLEDGIAVEAPATDATIDNLSQSGLYTRSLLYQPGLGSYDTPIPDIFSRYIYQQSAESVVTESYLQSGFNWGGLGSLNTNNSDAITESFFPTQLGPAIPFGDSLKGNVLLYPEQPTAPPDTSSLGQLMPLPESIGTNINSFGAPPPLPEVPFGVFSEVLFPQTGQPSETTKGEIAQIATNEILKDQYPTTVLLIQDGKVEYASNPVSGQKFYDNETGRLFLKLPAGQDDVIIHTANGEDVRTSKSGGAWTDAIKTLDTPAKFNAFETFYLGDSRKGQPPVSFSSSSYTPEEKAESNSKFNILPGEGHDFVFAKTQEGKVTIIPEDVYRLIREQGDKVYGINDIRDRISERTGGKVQFDSADSFAVKQGVDDSLSIICPDSFDERNACKDTCRNRG